MLIVSPRICLVDHLAHMVKLATFVSEFVLKFSFQIVSRGPYTILQFLDFSLEWRNKLAPSTTQSLCLPSKFPSAREAAVAREQPG